MKASVQSLRLSGEIDFTCKEELTAILAPFETADVVALDFGGVTFFDSTAISCLIALHRRMRENGTKATIRIVEPSPTIRHVLEVTNLTSLFSLYGTRAEAFSEADPPGTEFTEASHHFGAPDDVQGTLKYAG